MLQAINALQQKARKLEDKMKQADAREDDGAALWYENQLCEVERELEQLVRRESTPHFTAPTIRNTPGHYTRAEAEQLIARLSPDLEENWTYRVYREAGGTHGYRVAAHDEHGHFVDYLP